MAQIFILRSDCALENGVKEQGTISTDMVAALNLSLSDTCSPLSWCFCEPTVWSLLVSQGLQQLGPEVKENG